MSPPTPNLAIAALDRAGVKYAVRQAPSGQPYAGFRWSAAGVPEISFTAIAQGAALRVTAHDLTKDPALTPVELSRRARSTPLVRPFRSPESGAIELACAFDASGAPIAGPELLALLLFMAHARAKILGSPAPDMALPAWGPERQPTSPADWARALGLSPEQAPSEQPSSDVSLTVPLPGLDASARVSIADAGWGWLTVAGAVTEPSPTVLREDQLPLSDRLQTWAPVGRFLLSEARAISAEVTTPLLGRPPPVALRASLDAIVKLLGTARVHASR